MRHRHQYGQNIRTLWLLLCLTAVAPVDAQPPTSPDSPSAPGENPRSSSEELNRVAAALRENHRQLGPVEAVVTNESFRPDPSGAASEPIRYGGGDYRVIMDAERFRSLNYKNARVDQELIAVTTQEHGEWKEFSVKEGRLTRHGPDFNGLSPIDPRMAFLFLADYASLNEFPSQYTFVGSGTDPDDKSLHWVEVRSPSPHMRGVLRIWLDDDQGGLPVRSRHTYASPVGTIVTRAELTYRPLPDRVALLVERVLLDYYKPAPRNQPFDERNWAGNTVVTLSEVKLLTKNEADRAFAPESTFGEVTNFVDDIAGAELRRQRELLLAQPPTRQSQGHWLVWVNAAVLLTGVLGALLIKRRRSR